MRKSVFGIALTVALLASVAIPSAAFADGEAAAVRLRPAFEVFIGYSNPVALSYAGAHGTVVAAADDSPCLVIANGLRSNINYTVFVDLNGHTPGNPATIGPFVLIGNFDSDKNGNGRFLCSDTLPSGSSVWINQADVNATVLISGNVR